MKRMLAWTLAATALMTSPAANAFTFYTANATLKQSPSHGHLAWNGEVGEYLYFPADGTYRMTIRAAGMLAAGVGPDMALRINQTSRATVRLNHTDFRSYSFDVAMKDGVHQVGAAFINDETINGQDRNLLLDTITVTPIAGGGEPSVSSAQAWNDQAQLRDADILAQTNAQIAEHRMAPAQVLVVDANGNPVSGAQVEVVQQDSEFKFGANLYGFDAFTGSQNDTYKQRFSDLFNYATVPFYWSWMEPVQGQPNYAPVDAMVNWANANGIDLKGHAVLYGDTGMVPAWAGTPSQSMQLQRVTDIFNRYGASINKWDLVNEPVSALGPMVFAQAYQHAKALQPNSTLLVNEYGQFFTGFDMFFANGYQTLQGVMQQQLAAGTPIDVVGIQAHAPLDTAWPLETVWNHLNTYAALGTGIHITEFMPCSNNAPVLGTPYRGTWTEATQAQFAEDFYRVCFAHPAVDAISWWDFADTGAWLAGGGMLRGDFSAKPVYDRLKQLVKTEWRTNASGASNAQGRYLVDAFHGKYTVRVTHNGTVYTEAMNVSEDGDNVVSVSVAGGTAPAQDTTKPVITLNGAATLSINQGSSYTDAGATASDDKDGNLTGSIMVTGAVNASVAGVYTLTYTVSDAAGNAATPITRTVTVVAVDTVKPVITLVGSSSISIRRNRTFTDPGATATDNVDGNLTSSIVRTGTVNTSKAGTYYLYYNVKDKAGNTATQVVRTVKVSWF
jgi:GH35 family endo-1,4-beta-xylanase